MKTTITEITFSRIFQKPESGVPLATRFYPAFLNDNRFTYKINIIKKKKNALYNDNNNILFFTYV